jgi:hypothetical protein
MSRAPREPSSIPMHAALSPYGVIDFANKNSPGDIAAMMQSAGGIPGSVTGGPPAYLEAHGIRYIPSFDLGADMYDAGDNPLLVPMGHPDGGGVLDSSAGGGTPASYVSPHELNTRVDDRIRRFMDMQSPVMASSGAHATPSTPPGYLGSHANASSVDDRLRNLRHDCEMAASRQSKLQQDGSLAASRQSNLQQDGSLAASRQSKLQQDAARGSTSRLNKLQQEAVRASYPVQPRFLAADGCGGRKSKGREARYYDF